jgi:hypothetical protein
VDVVGRCDDDAFDGRVFEDLLVAGSGLTVVFLGEGLAFFRGSGEAAHDFEFRRALNGVRQDI